MKARILFVATLLTVAAGSLTAADPQLLNLVMPDAKVVAGVNVDQAKASALGQYFLSQAQASDARLQDLAALTGFDPRRDVRELLAASNGAPGEKKGIVLARGVFDSAKIAAAARLKGALAETYQGVLLLEDPKQTHALAFLDASLAVAGDIASVKSAIDRRSSSTPLPTALAIKIGTLGASQDAWAVTTVPPSQLQSISHGAAPALPQQPAFQNIQQASAGLKFGDTIALTADALASSAQEATSMADALKFLASMAQMQANQNPPVAALLKSLVIGTQGATVTVTASLPEDQLQNLLKPKAAQSRRVRPVVEKR